MKHVFWLEQKGTGVFGKEEELIKTFLEKNFGNTVDVVPVGKKQVKKLALPDTFVFASGSIGFMREVLRKYERELPLPYDYPYCVLGYLRRRVEQMELKDLKLSDLPKFIKPARDVKRFPGFVCHDFDDFRLQGVSQNTPIHVCDPVEITEENRVYYFMDEQRQIADIHCRIKDHELANMNREIANLLTEFGYPRGSFDVGKINGKWALVEVNDAFSLGAQDGVPAELYFRILFTRFQELIK